MRIFLSAGEASGDAYGAALVREMRAAAPDAQFEYEGGGARRMLDAGVRLIANTGQWGAISITQAVRLFPRIVGGYYRIKGQLRRGTPGLFIPIDFGYVNIRLARHAKRAGWRVLYFVPPGSWRRDRQGRDLPMITDAIATPFSWSADLLNEMGGHAHWFGHPIKQLVADQLKDHDLRKEQQVAVLPGSREHELAQNLPLAAAALRDYPGTLEFALAPTADTPEIATRWQQISGREGDQFTSGQTIRVLGRSRAALVCSGTATLEAALADCPMVVMYQLSPAMRREAKLIRMKRPKYIALPNILLDRPVVPEYAEASGINPADLRRELDAVLPDGEARATQLAAFAELMTLLGPDDAISQTATLAIELAKS